MYVLNEEFDLENLTELDISLKSFRPEDKIFDFAVRKKLELYGPEAVPPAEYSSKYQKISRDPNRRMAILRTKGGTAATIFLKRVNMFQHQYWRMEGLPVLEKEDPKESVEISQILLESRSIKRIGVSRKESEILERHASSLKLVHIEPFYQGILEVEEFFKKVTSNKWKRKRKINRNLGLPDLKIEDLTSSNLKLARKLTEAWLLYKGEDAKGCLSLSRKILTSKESFLKNYFFYWKDIPLSLETLIIQNESIAYSIAAKSVVKTDLLLDSFLERTLKVCLQDYLYYHLILSLKEMGISWLYIGGVFPTMKNFKETVKSRFSSVISKNYYYSL